MENAQRTGHLTDDELFGLALPPAGAPEALPPHLLACASCGRALQEWKAAVHDLGREQVDPLARRSAADWRAAEDRTLERVRSAASRPRRRVAAWAVGLAAAVLVAVVLLPDRLSRAPKAAVRPPATAPASELTGQDAADDALLREVARLAQSDDAPWEGLVPDPSADDARKM
jgi:hypothetical protein